MGLGRGVWLNPPVRAKIEFKTRLYARDDLGFVFFFCSVTVVVGLLSDISNYFCPIQTPPTPLLSVDYPLSAAPPRPPRPPPSVCMTESLHTFFILALKSPYVSSNSDNLPWGGGGVLLLSQSHADTWVKPGRTTLKTTW